MLAALAPRGAVTTMPIELNRQLLVEIGLGHLPADLQERLLQRIYDVLELRVGAVLGERLSTRQLDDFERTFKRADEAAAHAMLEHDLPEYGPVVRQEFEYILTYVVARLAGAPPMRASD
jgi:hypothetical protein